MSDLPPTNTSRTLKRLIGPRVVAGPPIGAPSLPARETAANSCRLTRGIGRLTTFLALVIVSLLLAFALTTPEQAKSGFLVFGYWNVLVLFGALVAIACRSEGRAMLRWLRSREGIWATAACIMAALWLYAQEGGGFKIYFDEHVLSNVALNLYKDHLPVIRESSLIDVTYYETIDKRPLLFPALLSLVHGVTGFRVENAFYLNLGLTAAFLLLLYGVLRKTVNPLAGAFAALLACFTPLIGQNASGGGFDMLNLCCFLGTTWCAMRFWERPDAGKLSLLAVAAALSSHARYESILIIAPVAALIAAHWWRQRRLELPLALLLIPLSFIPLVWQFRYVATQRQFWQYSLQGDGSFDLGFVPINLQRACDFLFVPSPDYAGSPFIASLGAVALLGLISLSITRREWLYQRRPDRIALLAMSSALVFQTALVLSFTFGQLDNPVVSRLGLPLLLLLIGCGAIGLAWLKGQSELGKTTTLVVLACCGLYAFKMYSKASYTESNGWNARSAWSLRFARSLPPGRYLFITSMPRVFELEGLNNLSAPIANARVAQIKRHLDIGTYDGVYAIQHASLAFEDGEKIATLDSRSLLHKAIRLETITERSFVPNMITRIARVSSIELEQDSSVVPEVAFDPALSPAAGDAGWEAWRKSLP